MQLRQDDRLEILGDISRAVSATLDGPALYETIWRQISRVMDARYFLVALIDPEDQSLRIPYCRQKHALLHDLAVPAGPSVTRLAIEHGLVLTFNSTDEYDGYIAAHDLPKIVLGDTQVVEAAVFAPLTVDGHTIGVLSVQSSLPHTYTADDVRVLTIIAAQAAIAIQHARLFEEQRHLLALQETQLAELRALQESLRGSEERYRTLVETSPDSIILTDPYGSILMVNPAAVRLFGFAGREAAVGKAVFAGIIERDRVRAADNLARRLTRNDAADDGTEYTLRRKDGATFPAEVRSSVLFADDGTPRGVTIVIRDITEQRRLVADLQYQASHDALTHLPNRVLFKDRLERAIQAGQRTGQGVAILLADLNGFKEVNDTIGHHAGDALLRNVAYRLQNTLRTSDTVARLGGDEFAVLLLDTDQRGAILAAGKLRRALEPVAEVEGQPVDVGASVGIALYPAHGTDGDTLLRHADIAMYLAKRLHTSFAIYRPDQDPYCPAQLALGSTPSRP